MGWQHRVPLYKQTTKRKADMHNCSNVAGRPLMCPVLQSRSAGATINYDAMVPEPALELLSLSKTLCNETDPLAPWP